jgi:hypothetical protein
LFSENSVNHVIIKSKNGWDHKWLNEGKKGSFISGSSVDDRFLLELSEENKRWLTGSKLSGTSIIKGVNKFDIIIGLSKCNMSIFIESIIGVGTKEGNSEFISGSIFFKSITSELKRWWSSFLLDP